LADEPTGNLDSKASMIIMDLLKALHEKEKKTLVVVTHDKQVAKYAERIIMLKDGKAVA
ncbi:TPA: ABC transporter ATP-binding protein, partial [Candidatus Woesearchaeota archaeon]|nr:ABC transporter ATP-binding protein [Candidatus Woesearchaeota archaeon]